MNIVFASSDLYSRLGIVTIKSILINSTDINQITIYYIGNGITDRSKKDLVDLVTSYNRNIIFLPMPEYFNSLKGSNRNGQTVFCYCYFQDILPESVEKVLLLEGDTMVTHSLKEFYETDITNYYIAAVDDLQSKWYKRKLGMKDDSPYVNCGVILYNLKKWRKDNISRKISAVLDSGKYMLFYDVQDVINYTVEGGVKVLPPKFNCTTAVFLFNYKNMLRYRRPSTCCSEKEFNYARQHPVVVHFTKNQILQPRPWIESCEHPFKEYYMNMRSQTVMANEKLWNYKPDWKNKLAHFLYTSVSKSLTAHLLGVVHSFLYPLFMYKFLFKTK